VVVTAQVAPEPPDLADADDPADVFELWLAPDRAAALAAGLGVSARASPVSMRELAAVAAIRAGMRA
jgi:hypothetical protein